MSKLDDIQKEVQQMGDNFQRLQASVAQLAKEQEQSKEVQAGETQESLFAVAARKGAAYPLEGHVIGAADMNVKEAYLSLLLFTWSLLQPEAKDADTGLVTVARIRASLHVDTSLYNLFCHTKEAASTDLETWFQTVDRAGGKSAYLLDTLILCQEMKAESNSTYEKLSQLYLLMGCQKSMLEEVIVAAGLIYERNRYKYILYENHKWKSFDGKVGECYLNLVGDLNTPGQVEPTSYYALWPERAEKVTGVSKYAPKVMLKIEVAEGAAVEKGQTLFTVYGVKESVERGFLSGRHSITYCGTSDWGYILMWKYNRSRFYDPFRPKFDDSNFIKREQKQLEECILNGYDILSVKADRDGIVHWQSCVNKRPFWSIDKIDYEGIEWKSAYWNDSKKVIGTYGWKDEIRKEGIGSIDLEPGDVFVSSASLTPETLGKAPICVVETM